MSINRAEYTASGTCLPTLENKIPYIHKCKSSSLLNSNIKEVKNRGRGLKKYTCSRGCKNGCVGM